MLTVSAVWGGAMPLLVWLANRQDMGANALNGITKGVIEGADFAAAYFAIWLGQKPLDRSLRDQLLNDRE
jgi:hypothetical protein